MAPAALRDVFNVNRFPDGLHFTFFLLYFPFGAFLCILRLLFCVQIGIILLVLPKGSLLRRIILRIHGVIIGIIVFVEGNEASSSFKVAVCNGISQLDCLILESIDNLVLISKTQQLPFFLHWLMGYPEFSPSTSNQMSTKLNNYCSHSESKGSVLIFPEEATTNGNVGLLKFSSWPFDSSLTYQPIVLKADRPQIFPKLSVIDGSFLGDFLWTLFVPYTVFHVRYLPEVRKEGSVSAEDFAKSISKKMAESLGLHPSQFDLNDRNEFIKRIKRENEEGAHRPVRKAVSQPQQRPVRPPSLVNKNERMVQQVKDVFPQVPIDVIRKDILKSKSVDGTLANILEGKVLYTALTSEEIEIEKRMQAEKKAETGQRRVKDSQDLPDKSKSLSFQEKKKLMIDNARRRYLEKHPEYLE